MSFGPVPHPVLVPSLLPVSTPWAVAHSGSWGCCGGDGDDGVVAVVAVVGIVVVVVVVVASL